MVARTGAKAARLLRYVWQKRGIEAVGVSDTTGNRAFNIRAKRYRVTCADEMDQSRVRVVSLAQDASRMGGKDMMFSALWSSEVQKGC